VNRKGVRKIARNKTSRRKRTTSNDMHPLSSIPIPFSAYRSTVYTGGAAHSRPQAEAEEMKKDLETDR
jgi:hypothetical protein